MYSEYEPIGIKEPMLSSNNTYNKSPSRNNGNPPNDMNIQPIRLDSSEPKYQDKYFALFFIFHLIVIGFFGIWKGYDAMNGIIPDSSFTPSTFGLKKLYFTFSLISIACMIISLIWMKILVMYANQIIRISLWTNVIVMIITGLTTSFYNPLYTLLFFIGICINIWYIYSVENRIAFASSHLKTATIAISQYKSIFSVSVMLLLLQLIWVCYWLVGTMGIYQLFRENDDNCAIEEKNGQICGGSGFGAAGFALLISLFWGQQVVRNILTCTTAGIVATWWYQTQNGNVVYGALRRSATYSFGSICFGSLLVAILSALRFIAQQIKEKCEEDRNSGLACLSCIAELILSFLESAMQYINMWAYCYVGIYGYDFKTSGLAVLSLFKNRGWTAVINDDLASNALSLGGVGVGLFCGIIGVIIAKIMPQSYLGPLGTDPSFYAYIFVFSLLIGIFMASILNGVILTAIHTIFICFAEDPIAFRNSHPEHYGELVESWKKFHPDAWMGVYATYV